jgi:enoyl-CoA hydratase/carnithine racemase
VSSILLDFAGATARLSIDNPARRNALTRGMWRELPEKIAQALQRPGVRAIILQSSTPGCFAAGADISEFEATYASAIEAQRANDEIHAAVQAMADCPLPTVALIDGPCVGGGMALALGCDMRLATDRARFAITPARLGLSYHPDDISRLLRACGQALASELLFGAQIWPAERGLNAGLVNQLFASDAFAAGSEALIAAICANSLDANRALKRGIATALQPSPDTLKVAVQDFAKLFASPDFIEGRDAFLQKRTARFPSHN